MKMERVCILPRMSGIGGMVSFQGRITTGLAQHGLQVCHDLADIPYQAILVVGGTRQLLGLWRLKRRGVRIVQRLDGMNWVHRIHKTGIRHYLRAELGNRLLRYIRDNLADRVVYQSEFARRWWERQYGVTRVPALIVHNGVDLEEYTPQGPHQRPVDCYRILMVEGSLMGGYELGLEVAVGLVEHINNAHSRYLGKPVELMIVGRVAPAMRVAWEKRTNLSLRWEGILPGTRIPEIDRSAHLLYSADVNPACPNSVIEALACGLPVLAFDTGALSELVTGDAGRLVSYGGDPWRLERPDIEALSQAALEILTQGDRFRQAARQRAEEAFGLERTVAGYLVALLDK